jgi:hypothetical protein
MYVTYLYLSGEPAPGQGRKPESICTCVPPSTQSLTLDSLNLYTARLYSRAALRGASVGVSNGA